MNRQEPDLEAILTAIESDQAAVDNAIVEERNRDMKSVKQDLEQLKDVTFDVASLVVEQGDQLSASHVKTKRARMAVESGTRELKFARTYKRKSRKKCFWTTCCILTLLLIAGGVSFVLFYHDGEYWIWFKAKTGI